MAGTPTDDLEQRTLKRLDDIRALAATALHKDPFRWTADTLSERITQVTRLHHGTIRTVVSAVFAEARRREELRRERIFRQWLRMGIRDRSELARRVAVEWQLDEPSALRTVDRFLTTARRDGSRELAEPGPTSSPDMGLTAKARPNAETDWDLFERRINRLLTRRDVGMVRLAPQRETRAAGWTLRLDWVSNESGNTVHIVCRATQSESYTAMREDLPLRLSNIPSQSVERGPSAEESLPLLLIRRESDAASAASFTVRMLRDSLGLYPRDVVEAHQTLEMVADNEIQRVRRLARAYRDAPSGYCVECHRPLSDPDSLARGWGPVCYERLHPHLKTVVSSRWSSSRAPEMPQAPGGLPQDDWAQQVATNWWRRVMTAPSNIWG